MGQAITNVTLCPLISQSACTLVLVGYTQHCPHLLTLGTFAKCIQSASGFRMKKAAHCCATEPKELASTYFNTSVVFKAGAAAP